MFAFALNSLAILEPKLPLPMRVNIPKSESGRKGMEVFFFSLSLYLKLVTDIPNTPEGWRCWGLSWDPSLQRANTVQSAASFGEPPPAPPGGSHPHCVPPASEAPSSHRGGCC